MKVNKKITKQDIEKTISSYDIYRYYLGEFQINKPFCNIIRGDKHPSMRISSNALGELRHFDFGSDLYRGNCYDLVMQIYSCDFNKALTIISRDFKLGTKNWTTPEIIKKKPHIIQVATRDFSNIESNYWKDYLISERELLENNIFAPEEIIFNRRKWPIGDMKFAYKYGNSWKIYSPLAEKGEKWVPNNVHITEIDGEISGDKIIICGSRKDYIVVKKIFPNTIGLQNESLVALSDENISYLRDKEVYLFFDSDAPGKEASHKITSFLGYKHINTPDHLLDYGIKDPSDWVKNSGYQPLIDHLKWKIKL